MGSSRVLPHQQSDGGDWLPPTFNRGHRYTDRVTVQEEGLTITALYAARHRHTDRDGWRQRLAAGEICRNGQQLRADETLAAGDRLAWHRPPWQEAAVPAHWSVLVDDGDLLVLDKPSGLPVLPAGGFLDHTLLRLLERRHADDPAGLPRPVHRLGRHTSGLLVCARRPATRAWLSAQLRESTAHGSTGCRKRYLALLEPGALPLEPGQSLAITVPIGRRPHPRLGQIWSAAPGDPQALPSRSELTLLEWRHGVPRVSVTIATGRPHQIRIHCAAIGVPLLGDPLYLPGGTARSEALPGDGGYRLRAQTLQLIGPDGSRLDLEAEPPPW